VCNLPTVHNADNVWRTVAAFTAMLKVTGSLQKSTEIMKLSNSLIKLPQVSQVMREMSMEMTKVRREVHD